MGKAPVIKLKDGGKPLGWAMKDAANHIGNKIGAEYENAINVFYRSYYPARYERTDSLYQGEMGVGGKKIYHTQIGKYAHDCGLEVGPEFYDGNPYEKNPHHGLHMYPMFVFPLAFFQGIHGFSAYYTRGLKNKETENNWWKTTPPKTTPPERILNKRFRKIDNANYVYGIVQACLDRVDLVTIE